MRVVSQQRDFSFDFDRTIFWTQQNVIYAKIGNDNKVIGRFENEKRAQEIFMHIHDTYADGETTIYYIPKE